MVQNKKWMTSPLFSLLAAACAIGSGVFGVTEYFSAQKVSRINESHQIEINQLKSQLAAIHLHADDRNGMDIASLVLSTGDANSTPTDSQYFPGDSFYAPVTGSHWNYQAKSEADHYRDLKLNVDLDSADSRALAEAKVHVWTSGKLRSIFHGAESFQIQPMILVQRMDDESIAASLGAAPFSHATADHNPPAESFSSMFRNASARTPVVKASASGEDEVFAQRKILFDALREDRAGKYFQILSNLKLRASLGSPTVSYLLNRVQKRGDDLYAQSSIVLHRVIVDQEMWDRFYLHNEEILVVRDDNLYLIRFTIPSAEPVVNDHTRSIIVSWLDRFRIVER